LAKPAQRGKWKSEWEGENQSIKKTKKWGGCIKRSEDQEKKREEKNQEGVSGRQKKIKREKSKPEVILTRRKGLTVMGGLWVRGN